MDEELGDEPPLPLGLTLFLAEGTWPKSDMMLLAPLLPCLWSPHELPHSKGLQHCPAYTGGARPKVPTKPSSWLILVPTPTKAKREARSS